MPSPSPARGHLRRSLPLLAVALLAAVVLACGASRDGEGGEARPADDPAGDQASGVSSRPNVLVVSFDALRADALGTYGYPLRTSPNIDAFAKRSTIFEQAYSAAPITPTSFAAAWTGQWPHRVFQRWKFIPEHTVGGLFADAGYRTAAFVNNVNLTEERDFGPGFSDYHWFPLIPDREMLGHASAWLEEHHEQPQRAPFFLWLHFNSPHAPYDLRPESAHLYDAGYEGRFQRTSNATFGARTPAEVARLRQLYDGEVYFADLLFGELMARLEELGRAGDTVVVLTADHGEEFQERGGFQHKTLHQEVLRVPLMIHRPGGAGQAGRRSTPVSLVDLMPTLLDLAALPLPADLDGVSLLDSLAAGEPADRPVYSEALNPDRFLAVSAVRGDRQVILGCVPQRSVQLMDLTATPSRELEVTSPEAERRVRDTVADLHRLFGGAPCGQLRSFANGDNALEGLARESIEALRSLGYLD